MCLSFLLPINLEKLNPTKEFPSRRQQRESRWKSREALSAKPLNKQPAVSLSAKRKTRITLEEREREKCTQKNPEDNAGSLPSRPSPVLLRVRRARHNCWGFSPPSRGKVKESRSRVHVREKSPRAHRLFASVISTRLYSGLFFYHIRTRVRGRPFRMHFSRPRRRQRRGRDSVCAPLYANAAVHFLGGRARASRGVCWFADCRINIYGLIGLFSPFDLWFRDRDFI